MHLPILNPYELHFKRNNLSLVDIRESTITITLPRCPKNGWVTILPLSKEDSSFREIIVEDFGKIGDCASFETFKEEGMPYEWKIKEKSK